MPSDYAILFPDISSLSVQDVDRGFSVHIFPEGFDDIREFADRLQDLGLALEKIAPFNLMKDFSVNLPFMMYAHWPPDPPNVTEVGPLDTGIDSSPPINRTNFDYHYYAQGSSYVIDLNRDKFVAYLETVDIHLHRDPGSFVPLKQIVGGPSENPFFPGSNCIIIILTPDLYPSGLSFRGFKSTSLLSDDKEFTFYMIKADENSGKFAARIIAEGMGLRTEIPLGPNLAPSTAEEEAYIYFAPNLLYLPDLSSSTLTPPNDLQLAVQKRSKV